MSIFNLVPSCKFCNSSLKNTTEFSYDEYLNPYERGFGDDLRFTYQVDSYDSFFNKGNLEIVLEDNLSSNDDIVRKAKENAKVFKIEELYNYHKDEVGDLIKKKKVYTDEYIEKILKDFPNLFKDKAEVLEWLVGNICREDKLNEKPLAKLVRDICDELEFK
ncbi:hypothetical protein [Halonatronum saccharophilum]|uniref:hypothetical protein n=1 Tax=Halonatronum saccharophilum TaxID=150060 RepID=UPI0012EB72E8|nr:hypothetical protein [Halonatronum saccharophilum]